MGEEIKVGGPGEAAMVSAIRLLASLGRRHRTSRANATRLDHSAPSGSSGDRSDRPKPTSATGGSGDISLVLPETDETPPTYPHTDETLEADRV